ncbi:MAG: hypothetical protein ACJAVN_000329 [Roseivirga sp.]|jgi:hypothetical protein
MIRKPNFKLNWKYALGELVLIFLGISLAIGFQNFNDNRKAGIKEETFLNNLLQDFQADSLKMYQFSRLTASKDTAAQKIKSALWNDSNQDIDSLSVIADLFFNGRYLQFDPFLPSYDELISSGQINLLKSEVLKKDIAQYLTRLQVTATFFYSEAAATKQAYNEHLHNYFNAEIMPYLWYRNRDLNEIKELGIDIEGFIKHPKSKIMVQNAAAVDAESFREYSGHLKQIASIIDILKQELK